MSRNLKQTRIGETVVANNGQKMKIIAYRGTNDLDIEFEDKTVVTGRAYKEFKKGCVANPNKPTIVKRKFTQRIGESITTARGLQMTIIAYRHARDIDIIFEDGSIVKNRGYNEFKKGQIRHPNDKQLLSRLNETGVNNDGFTMKIVKYENTRNIDVMFEDGTIVKNINYSNFKKGAVKTPTGLQNTERIGKSNVANNGQKMTIVEYESSSNITVMFEDNTLVKNIIYSHFKKGAVKNPNYDNKRHVGERYMAKNGMMFAIIKYTNAKDISIKFSDSTVVDNVSYANIIKKSVQHPKRPLKGFPQTIDNMTVTGVAYRSKNPNMFCECIHYHEQFIITYDEMKEHKCNLIKKGA